MGAGGTGAINLSVGAVRRGNALGSLTLLHPAVQRGDLVKGIGPFATAAVRHAGNHEEFDIAGHFLSAAGCCSPEAVLHALPMPDIHLRR